MADVMSGLNRPLARAFSMTGCRTLAIDSLFGKDNDISVDYLLLLYLPGKPQTSLGNVKHQVKRTWPIAHVGAHLQRFACLSEVHDGTNTIMRAPCKVRRRGSSAFAMTCKESHTGRICAAVTCTICIMDTAGGSAHRSLASE